MPEEFLDVQDDLLNPKLSREKLIGWMVAGWLCALLLAGALVCVAVGR